MPVAPPKVTNRPTRPAAAARGGRPRTVAMLAFPGAQALDVVGPLEVFSLANRWLARHRQRPPVYRLLTLGERAGPLATSGSTRLVVDEAIGRPRQDLDTLLVAGGEGVVAALERPRLLRWLAATAPHCRRFGSVCSGAFLLGQAGLLEGRRAATHWSSCADLKARFPSVTVDPDALYVLDGRCVTSAGITAGVDLALALVEQDLDRDVALGVARELVVFLFRSGGQAQFSFQLRAQLAEREPLRALQTYLAERPDAPGDVPALAKRAAMSPRHFARVFKKELGTTPGRYVQHVRLEAARGLLERTSATLDEVATKSGFGTAESLRRHFVAELGVSPGVYRARFSRRLGAGARVSKER